MSILRSKHGRCDMAIIAASNGTEKPFKSRSGRILLYCYDTDTGKHLYLDVEADMALTNEEAWDYMQMR